jgi:hypothetical protein
MAVSAPKLATIESPDLGAEREAVVATIDAALLAAYITTISETKRIPPIFTDDDADSISEWPTLVISYKAALIVTQLPTIGQAVLAAILSAHYVAITPAE